VWRSASRTAAPLLRPDLRTRRRSLFHVLGALEAGAVGLTAAQAGQLGGSVRLGGGDRLAEQVEVDGGEAEVEPVVALELTRHLADIGRDERDHGAAGAGAGGAPGAVLVVG
jgi:hypothetical protein